MAIHQHKNGQPAICQQKPVGEKKVFHHLLTLQAHSPNTTSQLTRDTVSRVNRLVIFRQTGGILLTTISAACNHKEKLIFPAPSRPQALFSAAKMPHSSLLVSKGKSIQQVSAPRSATSRGNRVFKPKESAQQHETLPLIQRNCQLFQMHHLARGME